MFSFLLYSLLRIKRYNTYAWIMSCIQQGCRQRGAWGLQPPQFLTDQLTLSQPGGADYDHHSTPVLTMLKYVPAALLIRMLSSRKCQEVVR